MALTAYRRKRNFRRTPEPRGAARRRSRTRLSYFIQKHAASRLHYDLRLELDGVLKSWAVPKGPCLDPSQRRLAVHVEDHPLEYGPFEGEIPKGEYGAGKVLLWDRGEWIALGDPAADYARGRLKFRLKGRKLSGVWNLVLMGGAAGEGRKNWLLIKENDEAALPLAKGDILAREESVSVKSVPSRLPETVDVELAAPVETVPSGEGWIHEIKYDGYRIVARVSGGRATLMSRRGNDWTQKFSVAAKALEKLAAREAMLDGEVVVMDEKGRSSFQDLQNALAEGGTQRLVYCVFDLLYLDGRDLREKPLIERKSELKKLLDDSRRSAGPEFCARIRYTEHIDSEGGRFFRRACELALEGVISKRKDASYRAGRSPQWLKIKCRHEQEFVIAGYSEPSGSRKNFGALVLGVQDQRGGLRYVGRVGTGFDAPALRRLHGLLRKLETPKPAFNTRLNGPLTRGVHWVRPELVAEVAFNGWTSDGILRQAAFKGLREDKPAAEVTIEKPLPVSRLKLTHSNRVLYPEEGLTKLALASYYESVAERLLAHAARRPLALLRCPNGRDKPCFFQKHPSAGLSDSIRTIAIAEKSGEKRDYLYIEDEAGLTALTQMGVLELHPWGSRIEDVERPDTLIFDLDPSPGTPWSEVVLAAREVRGWLSALKLEPFLKTTGGKGLHVVVPLKPDRPWPQVKAWCRTFAEGLAREGPSRYTTKLSKAARGGRLFIDYLRNERGATAVAPYSARARPGAPVATPLAWEELKPALKPASFGVADFARRLSAGDPWRGYEKARRGLPGA